MRVKSESPDGIQILQEIGLQNLPDDWEIVRIETLLSEDRGIAVGVMYPGDNDPSGIPLVRAGDLVGDSINPKPEFKVSTEKHREYKRTELSGGELLISLVGNVGRCAIVGPEMAGWNAARAVAVLRFKDPLDSQFVRFCLMSLPFQHLMKAWSTTTVQATLNLKEIRQIPIPWPPLLYRRGVVDVLTNLDKKIRLNRQTSETLEAMARAIFKDWFVDFGPTRAKMAGTKPYLAPDIWKLFPENLDDEGKPDGWKYETLRSLCLAIENGGTPSRTEASYWNGGTIPWLTSSEVRKAIVLQTSQFLTSEGLKNSSAKLWPSGTTVVAMYGATAGEVCLLGNMISSNQACCGLIPRPSFREYLFISVREAREELASMAVGSAQQNLSQNLVSSNRSLLPTEQVVSAYSTLVGPMLDRWIANEGEAETLVATRDLVLPRLMSGKIRIKEEAKKVEAELELHL